MMLIRSVGKPGQTASAMVGSDPFRSMIDTVLNFTPSYYLYFLAKEDFSGYHYFAWSLKEHLCNAKCYQRALNQALVYQ